MDLQAHFVEEDYEATTSGKLKRKRDAIPSVNARTFHSGVGNENPTKQTVPLPLYSSPALKDHNYADFITHSPETYEYDEATVDSGLLEREAVDPAPSALEAPLAAASEPELSEPELSEPELSEPESSVNPSSFNYFRYYTKQCLSNFKSFVGETCRFDPFFVIFLLLHGI